MKIIAISNQKGGTGKTSTTVNLAAALARAGKSVLLVDMDPQGSLTEYFTNPEELKVTMYNALLDGATLTPLVIGEHIQLLPSTIDLAAAEIQLPAKRNQERTLSRFLRQFVGKFDYCLLDCPPSLGVLTANALTAAHLVLVPVSTELMAERTVKLILNTIEDIKEIELNPSLKVWRILATIYDQRLAHHKEILAALRAKYGSQLYPEPVRATTKYKDAVTSGTDISDFDPKLGEFWDELAGTLIAETQEQQ
ncbi:MAG: ParA family protein [Ktedonobacteraceae bacterium]|nr:ParA family protein [Ktedonobacteraceae bacterium]